jgi:hypothetical protein
MPRVTISSLVKSILPLAEKAGSARKKVRVGRKTAEPDHVPVVGREDLQGPCFYYDVVRHRGHWRILHIGKYTGAYPTAEAALAVAVQVAKEKQQAGLASEVRLYRTDGQILNVPLDAQ